MKSAIDALKAFAKTHAGQQVGRFARVAAWGALGLWIDSGHELALGALGAAAVGGLEVAYRQWRKPAAAAVAAE